MPGEGQEHVVERRSPDPEINQDNAVVIQRSPGCDEHFGSASYGKGHLFEIRIESRWPTAETGDEIGGTLEVSPDRHPDLEDVAAQLVLELVGSPLGDDAPVVDDDDLVRQMLRLLHVLGREEHRRPLGHQVLDELPEVVPRAGIEPGGGFVQEQDRRSADQAGGQVESSPHPPRVRLDRPVPGVGERHPLERLLGPSSVLPLVEVIEEPDEFEVLAPGEELIDAGILPGQSYQRSDRLGVLDDVVAGDPGMAAVGSEQSGQHPDQRRLARAVGAKQRQDLPRLDARATHRRGPGSSRIAW